MTNETTHLGTKVVGKIHIRSQFAGRPCYCGCHQVAGLTGTIIESSTYDDIAIVEFSVPQIGGRPRTAKIAYTLTEIGF